MYFWYIRFVIEWIVWLIFADKKRWRELFPVSFFASLLEATTDVITHHIPLWSYDGNCSFIPHLLNDWGLCIVLTYLFIQWLPQHQTLWKMLLHWSIWTTIAITIEWIHVKTGHMAYHNGWSLWISYGADWILFSMLYQFHKIFHLEKLSRQ
jgi:hypothetical protein